MSILLKKSSFHIVAYGAILVALGVGLGYALAFVPNVELVSLSAVLAGYLLGAGWGTFIAAVIFLLYSFLSPFGMAPLPLWISQGIGGAVFGLVGAAFSKKLRKPLFAAAIAIVATLFYDTITNAAGFFAFPTKDTFIVYLFAGIAFSTVHIAANAVLFAILFPIIARKTEEVIPS